MEEIHQGFRERTYSGEDLMNYCRLSLQNQLSFSRSEMLYFFNSEDTMPTIDNLFDSIREKSNILIIIRTSNELFCIHIKDQIPKDIPQRRTRGSYYKENTFLRMREMYFYVICHKNEMFDEPKRIQNWNGEPKGHIETIKFNERGALMEFKNVFEIVSVEFARNWFDIEFKEQAQLYDEQGNSFSFEQSGIWPVQQIIACQLLDNE